MRGIDIGIDTVDTRFESTWYRYRKHKSGIAHHYQSPYQTAAPLPGTSPLLQDAPLLTTYFY